jgi:hypothetical protein
MTDANLLDMDQSDLYHSCTSVGWIWDTYLENKFDGNDGNIDWTEPFSNSYDNIFSDYFD